VSEDVERLLKMLLVAWFIVCVLEPERFYCPVVGLPLTTILNGLTYPAWPYHNLAHKF
jgi:hypothetical protein